MADKIPDSLRTLRAPYLHEYFSPWCVHLDTFRAAVERTNRMDLRLHVQRQEAAIQAQAAGPVERSYPYPVSDKGIAVVDVCGTLMKQESSLDDSCSSVMLRRTMRRLRSDGTVRGVMLRIDSPGGSSAGTQDLADDIAALAADKPCHAYIEDLGCSAAFWAASQCGRIATNRTGIVGSIGTYAVLYDLSTAAAMQGVQVHVIASGPLKGAGTAGTKITPEQLAEWQQVVDALNGQFLAAVARGRKLSAQRVAELADGGVHVGEAAKAAGLVDDVESFDAALARLESALSPAGPAQPPAMPRKRQSGGAGTSHETQAGGTSAGEPSPTAPDAPAGATAPVAESPSAQPQGEPMQQASAAPTASASDAPKPAPAAAAVEPKPASIAELKAAFPRHAGFALDCAEKALTMGEAKAGFADVLQQENEELRAKAAQQPGAQAPAQAAPKPGVRSLKNGAGDLRKPEQAYGDGESADQFKSLVDEEMKAHAGNPKFTRIDAVAAVARKNPELHEEFVSSNQHVRRK